MQAGREKAHAPVTGGQRVRGGRPFREFVTRIGIDGSGRNFSLFRGTVRCELWCRPGRSDVFTVLDVKTFLRPTPQQLRKALKRTPQCLRWACRGAYRLSVRLSDVEDGALQKLRYVKAIAWRRRRKMRSWAAKHPRSLLLAFPLWGDPRSFAEIPEQKLLQRILGVLALVSAAASPWATACLELQGWLLDMGEAKAVAESGQVAFDQFQTALEFACPVYVALVAALILFTATIAMLMHRLEIMVTHLDVRARPKVGFRFHVVQISSIALYLGLPAAGFAWFLSHRSAVEPLLPKALASPLILLPACLWLLLRPALRRNRRSLQKRMFGNAARALVASTLSTALCIGVLFVLRVTMK